MENCGEKDHRVVYSKIDKMLQFAHFFLFCVVGCSFWGWGGSFFVGVKFFFFLHGKDKGSALYKPHLTLWPRECRNPRLSTYQPRMFFSFNTLHTVHPAVKMQNVSRSLSTRLTPRVPRGDPVVLIHGWRLCYLIPRYKRMCPFKACHFKAQPFMAPYSPRAPRSAPSRHQSAFNWVSFTLRHFGAFNWVNKSLCTMQLHCAPRSCGFVENWQSLVALKVLLKEFVWWRWLFWEHTLRDCTSRQTSECSWVLTSRGCTVRRFNGYTGRG